MGHQPCDVEKMLKHYIYDYMIRKKLHASAEAFKNEVDIPLCSIVTDDFEGGFLLEWWEIFIELYFSKMTNQQGDQQATIERVPQLLLGGMRPREQIPNKRKQAEEMIGKRKKLCIEGKDMNTLRKSGEPSYITSLIPENLFDYASMPFDPLESFEFLQRNDFFATEKNKGLDDLIDLNDVCLENIMEKALFPGEKGDIAKPSSMVMEMRRLDFD
ncbi:hypothetical protein J5N97_003452 [Dioscorea zingiberensis]|uniref:LisH domain-containing protein n=1 Tax=Dioscorea zingiberensis TaxID=325984 RepID=A0A9D5HQJ0_9LILI|nr:hypothetical protein J5N97_003452 [Dioscorea zingiberensis]